MPLKATHIEINLDALTANFQTLSHHVAPAKVMCILKANAYGHGLIECAKHLEKTGAPYFGVARLQEGIELRQAGIKIPIAILAGILEEEIADFIKYDLDLTASSTGKMKAIADTAKKLNKQARVHLKVDTGLNRIGMRPETVHQLFQEALDSKLCTVVGVFTHLAKAEDKDPALTHAQLEKFQQALSFFEKNNYPMPVRHMANSAATLQFKECHLDMVRPGIALYGIYPTEHLKQTGVQLTPVMSLRSKVVYFKVVAAGQGVSYGHTWRASKDTRIVTIPVGYGDGYVRHLSNRASVLIGGKRHRAVGNIAMDQFMVDINGNEAFNGDEVVLIGSQGKEKITVEELASLAQTIPHEIVTNLNQRIPRVYTT